jgi:hypothetical protein
MDRYTGKCRTNYKGDRAMEVQDLLYSNLQEDMIESFQYDNINDNFSIILREENHTYEIITTEKMKIKNNETSSNTSRILLKECESHLKEFYQINQSESLYILKLDAKREGLENDVVQFLVYYPLGGDGDRLEQLDLTICEGDEIIIAFPSNKSGEDTALFDMNSDVLRPSINLLCRNNFIASSEICSFRCTRSSRYASVRVISVFSNNRRL